MLSTKEKNTIQQLIDSREAIKRKFNLLKRDKHNLKRTVEKTFEPIIDPLQKLVTLSGNEEKNKKKMKMETQSIDKKDSVESDADISDNNQNSQDYNTADEANSTIGDVDVTMTSENTHANSYLSLLNDPKKNQLDPWYGVRKVGENLMIGRENIKFNDNTIGVRNVKYAKTNGLMELLFRNDPNKEIVSEEDEQNYKQILYTAMVIE